MLLPRSCFSAKKKRIDDVDDNDDDDNDDGNN